MKLSLAFLFVLLMSVGCLSPVTNATYMPGDSDSGGEEEDYDEFVFVLGSIAFAVAHHVIDRHRPGGRGQPIKRQRRNIESIMYELGPSYCKRYLRMEKRTFWKLVKILKPKLEAELFYVDSNGRKRKRSAPNGLIRASTRVAVALRYLSGGNPLDICLAFGIGHTDVFNSVWLVVDAINKLPYFHIEYPSDHETQRKIAREFKQMRSEVGFHNCAGCIDGILIWTLKPTEEDLEAHGNCPPKKFFCARKHKFGLNMQAVCDARRRFLSVTMDHPGATSDYLAYISSPLYQMIERPGFFADGLCLYGDNAYSNRATMAIPFRSVGAGLKDDYNFYHSQVRINIECAFGILVRRFGMLRRAMPSNLTINKIRSLVQAMCKIHNFCIDEDETEAPAPTGVDESFIVGNSGGVRSLGGLVGGCEHRSDHNHRRLNQMDTTTPTNLPRDEMLRIVADSGRKRKLPVEWQKDHNAILNRDFNAS